MPIPCTTPHFQGFDLQKQLDLSFAVTSNAEW